MGRASGRARKCFEELEAMDHHFEPYGRAKGLVSPKEMQAKKDVQPCKGKVVIPESNSVGLD